MTKQVRKILRIDSTVRKTSAISRQLTAALCEAIRERSPESEIIARDLSDGIGLVNEAWSDADRTCEESRNSWQRALLSQSDAVIAELQTADDIVIGLPVFNFGIPATLKTWLDLVLRNSITYQTDKNGTSKGLLENKRAFVIMTSDETMHSEGGDHATGYITHALSFVGISNLSFIDATGVDGKMKDALARIQRQIEETAQHSGGTVTAAE